jgi:hypothetical protein
LPDQSHTIEESIMSINTNASLPSVSDRLSRTHIEVRLDGPAYWPDDPAATYPEVRVGVTVVSDAAASEPEGQEIRSTGTPLPMTNGEINNAFASLLQIDLTDKLKTEMSKYKPWELESDVRKGGLCPSHREGLESFLESKASEVARGMIAVGRPDWVTFIEGDRLQGDYNAQNGYETSPSRYRNRADDFPCQNAAPDSAFEDNCLCQTVTKVNSRFPLTRHMNTPESLCLTMELRQNPMNVLPRVTPKWTTSDGSLDLESPVVKKQLSYLQPLTKAFTKQFVKDLNQIIYETRPGSKLTAEIGERALRSVSYHHLSSPSGNSYPFSKLQTELNQMKGWKPYFAPGILPKKC